MKSRSPSSIQFVFFKLSRPKIGVCQVCDVFTWKMLVPCADKAEAGDYEIVVTPSCIDRLPPPFIREPKLLSNKIMSSAATSAPAPAAAAAVVVVPGPLAAALPVPVPIPVPIAAIAAAVVVALGLPAPLPPLAVPLRGAGPRARSPISGARTRAGPPALAATVVVSGAPVAPVPVPPAAAPAPEEPPFQLGVNLLEVHEVALAAAVALVGIVLAATGLPEVCHWRELGHEQATAVEAAGECLHRLLCVVFVLELDVHVSNQVG